MNDFPHKLNEWVDVEKEIDTYDPVIDKKGQVVGVKKGKRTVTEKTMYTRLGAPRSISCADTDHFWTIPDRHNHVAACKNCSKRQFIRAVYERIVDGKILPR